MVGSVWPLVLEAVGSVVVATVVRPFARSGWLAVRKWWRRRNPSPPAEELQFVTYDLGGDPVELPAAYALREFSPGEQVCYGGPYARHYTRVLTSEIEEDGVDRVRVAMDAGRRTWPASMFRHVSEDEVQEQLRDNENRESCPVCLSQCGLWNDGSFAKKDPRPIFCPHCNYLHSTWPKELSCDGGPVDQRLAGLGAYRYGLAEYRADVPRHKEL